jgi:hypothetical protein
MAAVGGWNHPAAFPHWSKRNPVAFFVPERELNLRSSVLDSSIRLTECDMTEHRRRVKQTRSLEERMAELAAELKDQANQLPAGAERERLLRKARFAETGARLSDWVSSSGLRPPE